jgi:hypothetical protein
MSFNKSLLTMISQDLKQKKKPSRPRAPKQQLMDQPNPFYIANSDIAGQGAFAGQYIPKGSMVDMLHQINQPGVDYHFTALGRHYNHSDQPNTVNKLKGNQRFMVATEDILPGQELTGNYRMQPDLEQPQANWKMRMGGLFTRSVQCKNCGHSWKSTDGGKDPLTCHKCGHLNLMQKGGQENSSTYVAPSNKIAQLQLLESPEYQYRKYLQRQPQLRQAPGRGEKLMRQGLGYADVATDVMQLGNFIPHPGAQAVGKFGNVAGSIVDLTQAAIAGYDGDYGSAVINAASAGLPSLIKNPNVLGGYRRSAKYNFGNRSSYLPVDRRYGRMTEKQLLGNRSLLGALGAETVYDAVPQKQVGGPTRISTADARYPELYKNRQLGRWLDENTFDSQVPLDEVVVRGNDERVLEGMRNTRQGFLEGVGTAMSFPQQEMMRMITGKRQSSPSEEWGFQQPGGWLDSYSSFGKNLSNFAMDAVLDPMNLVGVGLVDDISRAAVRGAARTARNEPIQQFARTAGSPDKVVFDLMDESIDPFAETLKNIKIDNTPSSFAEDVKREALEYQQLTRDPRYLERVQRIDRDFGSKLEPLLNSFNRSGAEDSGKFFPFNISIEDEIIDPTHGSVMGVAGLTEAGLKKLKKQKEPSFWPFNRNRNSLQIDPATDRYVKISERAHVKDSEPVRGTVHHELKHHWTNALLDADNQNYGQGLKSFIAPRSSVVHDPRNFDANRDYTYLSTPTEVDAHLMTNIRDEMVKRNYLKDHFDELSETKLDDFLSKEKDYRGLQEYFNPYGQMVQDKAKFVDFFNKYGLPATVTAGVLGSQATDKKKSGGQTRDEREMVNGIADILKQVKDKRNREQIARQMMADFEREDVTYDRQEFKNMAQLKYGGHGGLDRWFAEKWVDVKTGKDCGRQEGESRKGYPACRPSKRVTSETPKTAGELSSAEKAKFKREKTSSERISYNHKKEQGGQTGWLDKYK